MWLIIVQIDITLLIFYSNFNHQYEFKMVS
jgi:hypothetical protein